MAKLKTIRDEKEKKINWPSSLTIWLQASDKVTFMEYGCCFRFLTTTFSIARPITWLASRVPVHDIWSDHPHAPVSECWYPTTSPEDQLLVSNQNRNWVLSDQMITVFSLLESDKNMIDVNGHQCIVYNQIKWQASPHACCWHPRLAAGMIINI